MNIHDLAAPYALNALGAEEQKQFEAHLPECLSCQAEIADLQAATAKLGAAEQAAPPPGVRKAVMSGVTDIDQEAPSVSAFPRRRSRRAWWPAAAVVGLAAAVIVLAFVVVRLDDRVSRMDAMRDVMAAPDAAIATLDGGLGFQFYYSMMMDQAVLVSDRVPGLGSGETYEFWLFDAAGPAPAGSFTPTDGVVTLMVDGVAGAQQVAVSVELSRGLEAPTGELLAAAVIG